MRDMPAELRYSYQLDAANPAQAHVKKWTGSQKTMKAPPWALTSALKAAIIAPTPAKERGSLMYTTVRGSFFYFSYRFTGFAYRKAVLRCTD